MFAFLCFLSENDRCILSFSLSQVAWLMDTRIGQYLGSQPVLALTGLMFSAMAALPVGLFLSFALVTIVMSAVGFIFFEGMCVMVSKTMFYLLPFKKKKKKKKRLFL
uniref:Uncharacterized protein n=1 Tax=Cyclopterus lumpus TaxID=8103 RepID=A0A8C2ZFK5_CYCLU